MARNTAFERRPDLLSLLRAGVIVASDAVGSCIEAYAAWERRMQAFSWFHADQPKRRASELDRGIGLAGLDLFGLPMGVKDIFDTKGIPTEYGSSAFRGRVPTVSALAVSRLEAAGAIVFGKTVTAELAYFAPGPTANPWNLARTPGGSSMGSAAAVAAGVVPAAIGTQTNGSVIRPAAFCGIVGFKPSVGRVPNQGVLTFSPSLDQAGVFAASVDTAAAVAAVLGGTKPGSVEPPPRPRSFRLAVVRTAEFEAADGYAVSQFDATLATLVSAGASIQYLELPQGLTGALVVHRTLMAAEASQFIGSLVADAGGQVSPQLNALLEEGRAINDVAYAGALRTQAAMKSCFGAWLADFDALLTIPVLGEAPPIATTGDPRCCTRWTLVGAPALTMPTGLGPNGLPLGIQVIGGIGQDETLIDVARWMESVLPGIGRPPVPSATS